MAASASAEYAVQHLIDPEICIRCNTCEATCPVKAITHDSRNYVVDFKVCNLCNACIAPCPTGAIDHWRQVAKATPFTLQDQLSWDSLPAQSELVVATNAEVPSEVRELTEIATAGQGGAVAPPWSASHPYVNLYSIARPAIATVTGNFRLTGERASADIRHVVLDMDGTIYRGEHLFDATLPFLARLRRLGLGYTFFSGALEAWLVDSLKRTKYDEDLDPIFAKGQIISGAAIS